MWIPEAQNRHANSRDTVEKNQSRVFARKSHGLFKLLIRRYLVAVATILHETSLVSNVSLGWGEKRKGKESMCRKSWGDVERTLKFVPVLISYRRIQTLPQREPLTEKWQENPSPRSNVSLV
jgi:hypothetical protein